MYIGYLIKLLIFDFVYSFVIGIVLFVPSLLLVHFQGERKLNEQNSPINLIFLLIGSLICAGQGIIIAKSVEFSLFNDPTRWHILYYLTGFLMSVPIALMKGLNDNKLNWIGIVVSNLAYILTFFIEIDISLFNRIANLISI